MYWELIVYCEYFEMKLNMSKLVIIILFMCYFFLINIKVRNKIMIDL